MDYSDTSVNPDITRAYDNSTAGAYGKGKFYYSYMGGNETTGATVEYRAIDTYDALGRPLTHRQRFKTSSSWSNAFTTSQSYNLAGAITSQTYPSGHTTSYTYYDSTAGSQKPIGSLLTFSGNLGDGTTRTYADEILYNPQGQMLKEKFATSTALYHNLHYNARGQLYDVRLGTSSTDEWTWNRGAIRTIYDSGYAYGNGWTNNNGNVYYQDHLVPTALDGSGNVTQWWASQDYYFYDSLNRITGIWEHKTGDSTAETYVFTQQYIYDRYGNRTVDNSASDVPSPTFNGALSVDTTTNRLDKSGGSTCSGTKNGICYDAAGNQIFDNYTTGAIGGGDRTYDAENRMLTAVSGGGSSTSYYTYDADGRRTRRQTSSGTVWQVFGINGELLAEYSYSGGTATLQKEYGYRNGQMLVVAETGGTVRWLVTDALGSPRMMPDQTGSLSGVKRRDFLPYGEELLAGVGSRQTTQGYGASSDTTRQKFTGKEWDAETGLDYFEARYYSGAQGRFTSPDEFAGGPTELFAEVAAHNPTFYADIASPQSLNKYQYCLNNPLRFVDPDGHQETLADRVENRIATAGAAVANYYIGTAKAWDNIRIGIKNASGGAEAPHEANNKAQAVGMIIVERITLFGGLLGGGSTTGAVMAEANQSATIAAGVANAAQAEGRVSGTAAALVLEDGTTFTSVSTGASRVNHPEVQQALDNVPVAERSAFHGCCAEIGNINQAKNAGKSVNGATSATARIRKPGNPKHGTPNPACSTCQSVHKQMGVKEVQQ